jgi:hypothetical protein
MESVGLLTYGVEKIAERFHCSEKRAQALLLHLQRRLEQAHGLPLTRQVLDDAFASITDMDALAKVNGQPEARTIFLIEEPVNHQECISCGLYGPYAVDHSPYESSLFACELCKEVPLATVIESWDESAWAAWGGGGSSADAAEGDGGGGSLSSRGPVAPTRVREAKTRERRAVAYTFDLYHHVLRCACTRRLGVWSYGLAAVTIRMAFANTPLSSIHRDFPPLSIFSSDRCRTCFALQFTDLEELSCALCDNALERGVPSFAVLLSFSLVVLFSTGIECVKET